MEIPVYFAKILQDHPLQKQECQNIRIQHLFAVFHTLKVKIGWPI